MLLGFKLYIKNFLIKKLKKYVIISIIYLYLLKSHVFLATKYL